MTLQEIALYPARICVEFVLLLFGWELGYLSGGWQIIILGCVAFLFWARVFATCVALIRTKILGLHGQGGAQ